VLAVSFAQPVRGVERCRNDGHGSRRGRRSLIVVDLAVIQHDGSVAGESVDNEPREASIGITNAVAHDPDVVFAL